MDVMVKRSDPDSTLGSSTDKFKNTRVFMRIFNYGSLHCTSDHAEDLDNKHPGLDVQNDMPKPDALYWSGSCNSTGK